jgi:hypothetical protein
MLIAFVLHSYILVLKKGDLMSTNQYGKAFGFVIAIVLLLLYVGAMIFLVERVLACGSAPICDIGMTDGATYVMTTVGGLVSALVVAVLAITDPGTNPASSMISDTSSDRTKSIVNIVALTYLTVWVLFGLIALIIGVMIYPTASPTLNQTGTTWFGTAVAAAYAYFGIQQKS